MARVDFAFGASDKLSQACQTTLRQYLAGKTLLVFCSDAERLKDFDQKLWAVDDAAFVPHVMAGDPLAAVTPVILASDNLDRAIATLSTDAWLLNLDEQCPPSVGTLTRILEIVTEDDADKARARARWRAYQAAGHDLRSHRLA
jgi:DNA polymerase-3 subunit chi